MNGRESNEDGVVVVDGWTTVGGAAQAQDRAMTRAIKDDESESDETLSLSSHHKDTAAHHGETAQGAHDSPTRVAARLHPIIARPHDDGGGSPRIPRSAALRSSFTQNTRICYL